MLDRKEQTIKLIFRIIMIFAIIGVIFIVLLVIKEKQRKIYRYDVKIKNEEVLDLTKSDKKKCIKELIAYLNSEYYYVCESITFYINTFDKSNDLKYFYALVKGNDKSLIEIKNNGNGNFDFTYIGNEITPNNISEETGVSYLQITNPKKYINEKKEKEERLKIDSTQKEVINEW